jgi:hypothetical protein
VTADSKGVKFLPLMPKLILHNTLKFHTFRISGLDTVIVVDFAIGLWDLLHLSSHHSELSHREEIKTGLINANVGNVQFNFVVVFDFLFHR